MRNRKLIFAAVLAVIAVTFNACIDDPEPAALDVVTDAFVQKRVFDGEEKYALAFWAFANKDLDSAKVEGPGDETWILEEDESSSLIFSLFPEQEHYTDSMPPAGDYKFIITSTQNGEAPLTVTDKLEDDELAAVVIDSVQYVSMKLKTTWTEVEGADTYLVRLYDDSDRLIYVSPKIADDKTDFSFGTNDSGWADTSSRAVTGENYKVELLALLYESTSTASNQDINIQFISFDSKEIVWGE
jgi:hypothetical protein